MTTDEKIKTLVQSYVDELFSHDDMSAQENMEAKNDALVMCMAFAGHILETHCIIPKADIINQHSWYMQRMKEVSSNRQMNRGKAIALENLVGKELFNETEK